MSLPHKREFEKSFSNIHIKRARIECGSKENRAERKISLLLKFSIQKTQGENGFCVNSFVLMLRKPLSFSCLL
jgi:hypothetical protein